MAQRTAAAGGLQGGARGKKDGAHGKSHRATARTVSAIEGGASIKQARSSLTPHPPPLLLPSPSPLPLPYLSHHAQPVACAPRRSARSRCGAARVGWASTSASATLSCACCPTRSPRQTACCARATSSSASTARTWASGGSPRCARPQPCTRHAHATHTPCTCHHARARCSSRGCRATRSRYCARSGTVAARVPRRAATSTRSRAGPSPTSRRTSSPPARPPPHRAVGRRGRRCTWSRSPRRGSRSTRRRTAVGGVRRA